MREADHCIRSVRIPEQQVRILLDNLDALESRKILLTRELRKTKRTPYRTGRVLLHVMGPNRHIQSSFQVVARNISA